jgi:hypothetical protein
VGGEEEVGERSVGVECWVDMKVRGWMEAEDYSGRGRTRRRAIRGKEDVVVV